MANLDEYRKQIDAIDAQLVRLVDDRMKVARAIGAAKAALRSQPYHAGRHEAVIDAAVGRSDGSCPPDGLRLIFRDLLSVSLNLQQPLTVAYMGPIATFSHTAAIERFGKAVRYLPLESIPSVFEAVEEGAADYGVVPIENSTGGMVHTTLDCFVARKGTMICAETFVPIRNCLLSNVPLEKVKVVYSHPQPFLQCARWLEKNLPNVQRQEVGSTVTGVLEAMRTPQSAAIAGALASEHYGLPVVVDGIEDDHGNTTRFLVIAKEDASPFERNKTSIMFAVRNEPGALFGALQPFADRAINITKIESRPNRRQAWEPVFFADVIGHRSEANVAAALDELKEATDWLRILGSYPTQLPKDVE